MFRLLLACQMLLLYFSYAVAGVQVRDMKLTDPAVKACLIARSNEIDLSHDKLLSASVGDQLVVVWFGRKSDSEDPIKHLMCLFELNEDNKFVLKLIPGEEMTQLEEVQKDIEYLGLKPGEPGYESYQIKLELAGKALAEKKVFIRDAYEALSKQDYYPIARNATKLRPMEKKQQKGR